MAAVMPAEAKPGQGGGKGAVKTQTSVKGKGGTVRTRTDVRTDVRSGGRARTDARASARARARTGAAVDRTVNRTTDIDADGIPDYRDRNVDTRDARWVMQNGQWVRVSDHGRTSHPQGCPPGLANRTPACVPPGQAKRMWQQGQAVPMSWRDYVSYQDLIGRVPTSWHDDIPTGDYRYIYRDNVVYVVDPRTRLINRIIDLVD
jgi:hypothetical protein